MIYEFALDPAVVATWSDPREYALFRDTLCTESGRLGSQFPKSWKKSVFVAFEALPKEKRKEQARARLESLLADLDKRLIKRKFTCQQGDTWLEKAEAEHLRIPFRGILSKIPSNSGAPEVFTVDDVYSNAALPWQVPSVPVIKRTAKELVNCISPVLTKFQRIVLIDPYFSAYKRYTDFLEQILERTWSEMSCYGTPTVDLITAEKSNRPGKHLMKTFRQQLPKFVPSGHELKVTILKERCGGERFHNRYILTERVGVSFGIGLDTEVDEDPIATDDLCRLSSAQHSQRWGQFVSARDSTFDLAVPIESIAGKKHPGN